MDEFIELISNHDVEVVVDVRRYPSSWFEHFCREKLAGLLPAAGIDYIYIGGGTGWLSPWRLQEFHDHFSISDRS
jgi:uncharacterized protein (DUF488 family)